jgi:VanZ family protein
VGLALGNEVTKGRGWSGTIREATVTGGDVSVDLLDPASYDIPRSWWNKPVGDLYVEPTDVALNLLGFVPFGAVWVLVQPATRPVARSVARAVRASFLMSAAMELGQLAIASRDPSFVDLAVNTVGGGVGALLVGVGLGLRRRSRTAAR